MSGLSRCERRTERRVPSTTAQMSSTEDVKAHSASSIQNSARCRLVWERSARKQGESVYTREMAEATASRCSWEETVRYAGWLKYSDGEPSVVGDGVCVVLKEDVDGESEEATMRKVSPAPSQSLDVIIGVCMCTKPLFWGD